MTAPGVEASVCPTCEESPRTLRGEVRAAMLALVTADNNRLRAEVERLRKVAEAARGVIASRSAEGDARLVELALALARYDQAMAALPAGKDGAFIDVVFDGPCDAEPGRFVEVEDPSGRSVSVGQWIDRGNGLWALRIPMARPAGEDGRDG